jgi:hypothetical protein
MPGRDAVKWGREDLTGSAIDNSRNSHDDSPLRLGYLHTPDHTPQGRGWGVSTALGGDPWLGGEGLGRGEPSLKKFQIYARLWMDHFPLENLRKSGSRP